MFDVCEYSIDSRHRKIMDLSEWNENKSIALHVTSYLSILVMGIAKRFDLWTVIVSTFLEMQLISAFSISSTLTRTNKIHVVARNLPRYPRCLR